MIVEGNGNCCRKFDFVKELFPNLPDGVDILRSVRFQFVSEIGRTVAFERQVPYKENFQLLIDSEIKSLQKN